VQVLGPAKYATADGGTSPATLGNRAAISKNFNNTAKPSRVAPVLLPTSVHDATKSCADHSSTQMINAPYTGAVIRIDPIGHYLAAARPSQGTQHETRCDDDHRAVSGTATIRDHGGDRPCD